MRKVLFIICATLTLLLSSCESSAQIVYSDDRQTTEYVYYDYSLGTTVVYINSIPYYRYWFNNAWSYRAVPRDRWHYITYRPYGHYKMPYANPHHNPYTHHPQGNRPPTSGRGHDTRTNPYSYNRPPTQNHGHTPNSNQRGRR